MLLASAVPVADDSGPQQRTTKLVPDLVTGCVRDGSTSYGDYLRVGGSSPQESGGRSLEG